MTEALLARGRPKQHPDVWLRRAERENVVYDPSSASVHVLNDTATAIWSLCDGRTHPDEMVVAICSLSGLPREVVEEDVARILEEFEQVGIISWIA